MGRRVLIGILALAPLAACSLLSLPGTDGVVAPVEAGADVVDEQVHTEAAVAPSKYVQIVSNDQPVLWLRFDDAPGAKGHDQIAGADGIYTSTGVTYGEDGAIAGDPSKSVGFDGKTGSLAMPSGGGFDGQSAFSVELWAKRDPAAVSLAFLVDHEEWSPKRAGWALTVQGDAVAAFERYSDTANTAASGANLSDGKWHHLVSTYDGATMIQYRDGKNVGAAGSGFKIDYAADSRAAWTIAKQNCNCNNRFDGNIDELAIYDKVLLDVQVKAHFDAAQP